MASVFKLWASLRIRDILHWQETWADNALHGYKSERRAEDVGMDFSMTVESALADGSDLVGMSIDWSKYFDRVPQKLPSCWLRGKAYTLACCNRCMTRHVAKEFVASNGVTQFFPRKKLKTSRTSHNQVIAHRATWGPTRTNRPKEVSHHPFDTMGHASRVQPAKQQKQWHK